MKIKVAKSSEIADFSDFETKGEELEFTEGKDVNITYTAPEDDTYVFYIEDELGNKKMIEKRITSEDKDMNVKITQDENSPENLTIIVTNEICNIVEMKIAIGENINISYFENNGEEINITPGKEVTVKYTIDEDCTVNVYIKDEQGYSYMYSKQIIGVEKPEPVPNEPPEITLTQNVDNLKQIDVRVIDKDSYIDEVKWAKGSQNVEYFATNGTRIGQGSVGSSINTHFDITETGIYTVYAKDEDGNEVVKEINITNIEEPEEPEKDTTPPEISGVENQKVYNKSVTPSISDENLKSITLTKDGTKIETYKNGDVLEDDGKYILTAIDETGNQSIVEFIIDKTAPEIDISQQNTDNQNVAVSINIEDALTFIDKVKIAEGEQNIDYFVDNGQELDIENNSKTINTSINISKNGIYTVFAKDTAGNSKIQTFEVTTITGEPEVDDTITSSEYQIDTEPNYISKIIPETNLSEFKNNISTEIGYKVVNSSGEEIQDSDLIGTGYKLITDTNKEYTLIVTGDLTGDGNITLIDMSLLRKHYLEIESLQGEYLKAADMDNNNIISLRDIANMRKTILEIDE